MNKPASFAASRCVALVVTLVAVLFGGGCETAPRLPETPLAAPASPKRHVVRSAELRRIMQQLEMLMQDRIQSDLALDMQRIEAADALADVAGELAAAALSLSTAAVTKSLDEAGRQQFHAYALELQREAEVLRAVAAEHRYVASTDQFRRLNHACAGCHSLYRKR